MYKFSIFLLIRLVLHEYHEKHQTYPEKLTSNEDFEELIEIRNNVFERLRIDNDLLDEHHLRYYKCTICKSTIHEIEAAN